MDKYYPEGDKASSFTAYGYTVAQTLVEVLKNCKDDLTRANVMKQAASLKNLSHPMLLPGITINTSDKDFAPIKQMQMQKFNGERWELFGPIMTGDVGAGSAERGTSRDPERHMRCDGRAKARPFVQDLCGLIQRAASSMPTPIAAGKNAAQLPPVASAAVAAHEIDEKASAKVAKREAVWRWRK